jgi:hypothetical protein
VSDKHLNPCPYIVFIGAYIIIIFIVDTAVGDELITNIKFRYDNEKIAKFITIHVLYLPDTSAVEKSQ